MKTITPHIRYSNHAESEIRSMMSEAFDLTRKDSGALAMGATIEACADPYDSDVSIVDPFVLWRDKTGEVACHKFSAPYSQEVMEIAKRTNLPLTVLSIFSSRKFKNRLHYDLDNIRDKEEETDDGDITVGRTVLFLTDGDLLIGWNGEDDLSLQVFDEDEVEDEDLHSVQSVVNHVCLSLPKNQSNHANLKNFEKAQVLVDLMNTRLKIFYPFKAIIAPADLTGSGE